MDRGVGRGGGGGATVHGVAESDMTEATEHAHTLFVATKAGLLIMQLQKSVSLMILVFVSITEIVW